MALRIGLKVSIKTTETRRSKATGGTTAVVRRKASDGSFESKAIPSSRAGIETFGKNANRMRAVKNGVNEEKIRRPAMKKKRA